MIEQENDEEEKENKEAKENKVRNEEEEEKKEEKKEEREVKGETEVKKQNKEENEEEENEVEEEEEFTDVLNFLFHSLNKKLKFHSVDATWANDFIEIASSPPFAPILEAFNKSKYTLIEALQKLTHNIVIIEMPSNLSGQTLNNCNITIKLFENTSCNKGATFIIYLHELGHALQRLDYSTYGEYNNKTPSETNFSVKEGGELLEEMIFGKVIDCFTIAAAKYIVSKRLPDNITEFIERFSQLNEGKTGKKMIYSRKSRRIIQFGRCKYRY